MVKALCIALSLLFICHSASAAVSAPRRATRAQAAQPAKLSNKDVVEMSKAGLSVEVIVAKIKTSQTEFDTSPAALQSLKSEGVADAVILAMVQSSGEGAAAAAAATTAAPAPATATATATAGDGKVTVYVFRHKNFSSRNMQPSVYVDGEEVARIDDGKFFAVKLTPGKHTVEVNKGHTGAEVEMKGGEEYYFRVEYIPGFLKARSKIDFIQKEQGAVEIKKMKPLEDKWIKDKTRVVTDAAQSADTK
jgi:Protein of unknown function (DUF2846)